MTAGDLDSPLLGRIVRPADYVRVLATPMRLRSPHFAVHHLEGRPLPLKRPMARAKSLDEPATAIGAGDNVGTAANAESGAPVTASLSTELSTGLVTSGPGNVDDSPDPGPDGLGETPGAAAPDAACSPFVPQRWLGLVVPKRHAKRAVTRTLVKRQIRNVAADCAPRLEAGLWVVRQRSPFDPKQYPSAASDALKEAARAELRALFERAVRGERDKVKPRGPHDATTRRGKGGKPAKPPAAARAPVPPSAPEAPPCAA